MRVSERKLLLSTTDCLVVGSSLISSWILRPEVTHLQDWPDAYPFLSIAAIMSWLVFAATHDAYDLRIASRVTTSLVVVGIAALETFAVVTLLLFLLPFPESSHATVIWFMVLALAGLLTWRSSYAIVFTTPKFRCRALIVGAGRAGRAIAKELRSNLSHIYDIVGYIDDDLGKLNKEFEGAQVIGGRHTLLPLVRAKGVDEIILAVTHGIHEELYHIVMQAWQLGVQVIPLAEEYERLTGRVHLEHMGHYWYFSSLNLWGPNILYSVVKRSTDLVFSVIGLVILLLVLPFVSLAIFLECPGPVFYRPERLGLRGKPFRPLKFRSMIPNADTMGDPTFTQKRDPRISRVGRFLRKCRLDELPQVLNVLRGDMSVVGPRPERHMPEIEASVPIYRARLLARPGLTGWAQVKFGYASSAEETLVKLGYDLFYIKHQSILLDALILLQTFRIILGLKGQ